MFGSKLRSWMENHIVRPRKKGNKNKNVGGNLAASSTTATTSTANGHKGAASASHLPNGGGVSHSSAAADSSPAFATIASPARRCEVSPIQCHTASRAGWHSPQQETATSPQSDHYLYRHSVRSPPTSAKAAAAVSLAKSMPRKSSYTTTADYHHHQQPPASSTSRGPHSYPHQVHQPNAYHQPSSSVHYADGASIDVDALDAAVVQPSFSPPAAYAVDTARRGRATSVAASQPNTAGAVASMSTSRYSTTASSSSTSNEMLLDANTPRYERFHQQQHQHQQQPSSFQQRFDMTADPSNINSNTFTKSLTHHPHHNHNPLPSSAADAGSSTRSTIRDSLESSSLSSATSSSHLMHTSTTTTGSFASSTGDAVDVTVKMRRKPLPPGPTTTATTESNFHVVNEAKKHKTLEHRYGKIMQRNEHGELGFATVSGADAAVAAAAVSPFPSPSALRRRSNTTSTSQQQPSDRNGCDGDSSTTHSAAHPMSNGNEINQLHRNQQAIQQQHYSQSTAAGLMMCDNRNQTAAIYASNNNALDHSTDADVNDDLVHTRRSSTTTAIHVGPSPPLLATQHNHLHHNNINNNVGSVQQQQHQRQQQQQHKLGGGYGTPSVMTTFGNGINQHRLSPAPPPRRETLKPHHILQQQQQQQQQLQLQQQQQQHHSIRLHPCPNTAESNRNNMLRNANHQRYVNGAGGGGGCVGAGNWMTATAQSGANCIGSNGGGVGGASTSHHQLAHMINSLSSPESAYSTGYSTDGTSPGATTCTPEYYINMRTGTHYFPRAAAAHDANRVKFALNKIDEAPLNAASINGGPYTNQQQLLQMQQQQQQLQLQANGLTVASQRRLESMSCEMARRHFPTVVRGLTTTTSTSLVVTESLGFGGNGGTSVGNGHHVLAVASKNLTAATAVAGLSPDVQRRLTIQSYKGMESPSPRQRCRIRTNPWVSSIDPAVIVGVSKLQALEMETSSTSSGIKSSSDVGVDEKSAGVKLISSGSEKSSSDTEIEVNKFGQPIVTPGTVRKRRIELPANASLAADSMHGPDSDEDATFNEMMGKFDESYCYEKETDILSDSDPTECVSDLDTGQDGGDECETDDPLEIDYIDTASIQEVVDNAHVNTGNCSYHPNGASTSSAPALAAVSAGRQQQQRRGTLRNQPSEEPTSSASGRRRKRLTRTRKSSSRECRDSSFGEGGAGGSPGGRMGQEDRGTRSVGGTPVSLRRNKQQKKAAKGSAELKPMRNRANSLTFSDEHSMRNSKLAMAESEKALIRADLEADVKYKQLIHEAETILVSMKTSTSASPSVRETPVASPRRACSIPTNKRVEMLRQCEADLRREINKAQKQNESIVDLEPPPPSAQHAQDNINMLVNKRIEVLKLETISTPNSPKSPARFSPRKTHVSNFIHLNTSPTDLMRRKSSSDASSQQQPLPADMTSNANRSPRPQQSARRMLHMPKSPTPTRRRFRSQSPRVACAIDSDSDSTPEDESVHGRRPISDKRMTVVAEINGNHSKKRDGGSASTRRLSPSSGRRQQRKEDALNSNGPRANATTRLPTDDVVLVQTKSALMSFRSVDMGTRMPATVGYCPQSEPLKRKVYSGSHTLEKLKKTLEQESEIPKQALLEKISQLRRERKAAAAAAAQTHTHADAELSGSPYLARRTAADSTDTYPLHVDEATMLQCQKQQMILTTLAELKRSLEDQSVELCGLNDDDQI